MNRQDAKETKKNAAVTARGQVDESSARSEPTFWSLTSYGFQAVLGALGAPLKGVL
jgi:hypothetical protein